MIHRHTPYDKPRGFAGKRREAVSVPQTPEEEQRARDKMLVRQFYARAAAILLSQGEEQE